MILKDSQISLTYYVGGETLKKRGVYTVADVTVKNAFTKNEVFILNKPSQTVERPVFDKAQMSVTLSSSFIENCLTRPEKPEGTNFHRWLRTPMGQLYQDWKKFSDVQKIEYHIKQYVIDMGGESYSYQII